ncbi:MAG: TRAP transporter TatT component family protein [Gammaproteobacteria bacterium]|nr:TRAP transporter TatT component family protein [Gammaproteobacteria bacterium]
MKKPYFVFQPIFKLTLLALLGLMAGCSILSLGDNISNAILNQDDPKIVEDSLPTYLIMMDGMIEGDPENEGRLLAAGKLYAAYASMFVKEPKRHTRLMNRARDYSRRAICEEYEDFCKVIDSPFGVFQAGLQEEFDDEDDVPMLHTFAVIWAGYIKANKSNWAAVADLAKVKACVQKVIELDENYDNGSAHMYMGLLNTLLPAALGGKPELARQSFEKAIELSKGKNLMIKVHYAERYARLVFNEKLHNKLLQDVINADANVHRLTLVNTLAKRKAKELIESGKEYF